MAVTASSCMTNPPPQLSKEKSADAPIAVMESTADETDGIEVTARPLGPKFPNGMLVVMNSSGRNFWLFNFPSGSL